MFLEQYADVYRRRWIAGEVQFQGGSSKLIAYDPVKRRSNGDASLWMSREVHLAVGVVDGSRVCEEVDVVGFHEGVGGDVGGAKNGRTQLGGDGCEGALPNEEPSESEIVAGGVYLFDETPGDNRWMRKVFFFVFSNHQHR